MSDHQSQSSPDDPEALNEAMTKADPVLHLKDFVGTGSALDEHARELRAKADVIFEMEDQFGMEGMIERMFECTHFHQRFQDLNLQSERVFTKLGWSKTNPPVIPPEVIPPELMALVAELLEVFLGGLRELVHNHEPRTRATRVPDAFADGIATIPHNPAIVAAMEAISKGGAKAAILVEGWKVVESGCPVFESNKKGHRIMLYPELTGSAKGAPTPEEQWRFVQALGPLTSDVGLAILAQMGEPTVGNRPQHPMLEPVVITADAILKYKGISRYGSERRKLRKQIANEVARWQVLRFDAEAYHETDPKTGKQVSASWQADRVFDIVTATVNGRYCWSVRAGHWAYWWFNSQQRAWFCRMARLVLKLDHRSTRGADVMAKKIAQHVIALGAAHRQSVIELRIDNLLERAGELVKDDKREHNWAGRTRDRFDEAMIRLKELGVFQSVQQPGCRPDDLDDRRPGWVKHWLSSKVCMVLGVAEPDHLEGSKAGQQGAHAKNKQLGTAPISGAAIRRWRTKHNISQSQLAKNLGIAIPYLSQIENNRRTPSHLLSEKIRLRMVKND